MPTRAIDSLAKHFKDDEMIALAQVATMVEVPAGTKLTIEGTLGRQALVIVAGTASVVRNDHVVATVGPGDIVGEIALLSGEPRMATVVADDKLTAYAMSPRDFAALMTRCPSLARRFASTAVRRLSEV
jgi:CRP-like cAMP-binding protein